MDAFSEQDQEDNLQACIYNNNLAVAHPMFLPLQGKKCLPSNSTEMPLALVPTGTGLMSLKLNPVLDIGMHIRACIW